MGGGYILDYGNRISATIYSRQYYELGGSLRIDRLSKWPRATPSKPLEPKTRSSTILWFVGFLLIHNQMSVTAPLNEIYEMLTKRVGLLLLPRSTPSSSSCEGIYIKFLLPDVTPHISPQLYKAPPCFCVSLLFTTHSLLSTVQCPPLPTLVSPSQPAYGVIHGCHPHDLWGHHFCAQLTFGSQWPFL